MKKFIVSILLISVLFSTNPAVAEAAKAQKDMVEANAIDLSLHGETSGDFTPVYSYKNPFKGKDTSKGVVFEFYAQPTWDVHELGTIFAIVGTGKYEGRLYFTPGSYLGYNSPGFGGFFDANLFNYTIVKDYIKAGAKIKIEIKPDGFSVYSGEELCYDQTILEDANAAAGDFTPESDFSIVLDWMAHAESLYFGYGSWWNAAGTNEANIILSEVNFQLRDGTTVMDTMKVDKNLVESLGGDVSLKQKQEIQILDETTVQAEIETFHFDKVEYNGTSVLPAVAAVVAAVAAAALLIIVLATKKRTYNDI